MNEICCIGHITDDHVITPDFSARMPGGTAYYFGKALGGLAPGVCSVITAAGPESQGAVDSLRDAGCRVSVLPSERSVVFENRYGHDRDHRTQRVLAKAAPFRREDLPDTPIPYIHLGTLLNDDFDMETIVRLSRQGRVSVDIQGFLREVRGEDVVHLDYPAKHELMRHISILKANEVEMEVLTGSSDPYEAARILAGWGCPEVVLTMGSRGSLIYHDGKYDLIPAYQATEVVDATGCGDTYMAGYLYRRSLGESCADAGRYAAAMCTLKLEKKGPLEVSAETLEKALGKWKSTETLR
ncbi:MAG: ribokinase [Muribaculaceae bacterium]|nr:ribokinase [Muribaculaceae bacterium]